VEEELKMFVLELPEEPEELMSERKVTTRELNIATNK